MDTEENIYSNIENWLLFQLGRASDDVNEVLRSGDALVDSGYSREPGATRAQAQAAARALAGLEERARAREEELEATSERMRRFHDEYGAVLDDIQHVRWLASYDRGELIWGSWDKTIYKWHWGEKILKIGNEKK